MADDDNQRAVAGLAEESQPPRGGRVLKRVLRDSIINLASDAPTVRISAEAYLSAAKADFGPVFESIGNVENFEIEALAKSAQPPGVFGLTPPKHAQVDTFPDTVAVFASMHLKKLGVPIETPGEQRWRETGHIWIREIGLWALKFVLGPLVALWIASQFGVVLSIPSVSVEGVVPASPVDADDTGQR